MPVLVGRTAALRAGSLGGVPVAAARRIAIRSKSAVVHSMALSGGGMVAVLRSRSAH